MPNVIDQKVVQMEFDNKQFERGVAESLKSLEALKKGLELDKSAASLQNLEKIANDVDFGGIKKSIDSIGDHFTTLGRFVDRHVDQMVDKAINGAKRLISSISIDQVSKGMGKYEQYNKAVQMIRSALPEESMATIESTLAKLNEYTDLTSYDFTEMSKTIGKFTSSGIGLEDAELAMEGIANWSAAAGTEIAQANHAMYNLAQALGQGSVKLMDWRSIMNANMDTKEFKELAIDMAVKLGVLGKGADHTGLMIKGSGKKVKTATVDYKNFNSTLSDGWFTTEVLMATLKEYADRESEVGEKGFKAAREAITFTQAIDAIKDAVSTGWMKTFVLLVGNLEEATSLLTTFSDNVIDFAARIYEYRNNVLEFWHFAEFEDGVTGYTMAVEAFNNVWEIFIGIADLVKAAWDKIFPPQTVEEAGAKLVQITARIRDFTQEVRDAFDLAAQRRDTEDFFETLRNGHRSGVVKALNDELYELGYISKDIHDLMADKPAWETFNYFTEDAIKNLQAINGLDVTGVFDEATFDFLAKNYRDASSDLLSAMKDTSNETKDYFREISEGAKDSDFDLNTFNVTDIQKRLVKLGLLADEKMADGVYGPKTKEAIEKLQENYGLAITGVYDADTDKAIRDALGINSYLSPRKTELEMGIIFKKGDEGQEIKDLQDKLVELGYLADESMANGVFGDETAAALRKFQKEYKDIYKGFQKTESTGVFDEFTSDKLDEVYEGFKKAKYEVKEFNGAIEKGAKGDEVKSLQNSLVQLGYLADKSMADGVFGSKTQAAIKAFQKNYGLKETGVYDEETYKKIKLLMDLESERYEKEKKSTKAETKNSKARQKSIDIRADRIMNIQKILQGFFSIVQIGTGIFNFLGGAVGAVWEALSPLVDLVLFFGGILGDCSTSLSNFITENQVFEGALVALRILLAPLTILLEGFRDSVIGFFADHGDIKTFTDLWNALGDAIRSNPIGSFLADLGGTITKALKLDKISSTLSAFGDAFKKSEKYWNEWGDYEKTFSNGFRNLATRLWESENSIVHGVGQFMLDIYGWFKDNKAIQGIKNWISSVTGVLGSLGKSILSVLGSGEKFSLQKVWENFISNLYGSGDPKLKNIATNLAVFKTKIQTTIDTIQKKFDAFKKKINEIKDSIGEFFNNRFGTQIEQLKTFGETISDYFTGKKKFDFGEFWNNLTSSLKPSKAGTLGIIGGLLAGIATQFSGATKGLGGFTKGVKKLGRLKLAAVVIGIALAVGALGLGIYKLVNWFKGGEDATEGYANANEKLGGVFSSISDKFKTFGKVLGAFGKAIWQVVSSNGPIRFGRIWEQFISNLYGSGDPKLKKVATTLATFKTKVENAINAVKAFGTTVKNWFSDKIDRVKEKFGTLGKAVGLFGESVAEVFKSGKPITFYNILSVFKTKLLNSSDIKLRNLGLRIIWFKEKLGKAKVTISKFGSTIKKTFGKAFTTAFNWIIKNVPKAWNSIRSFFTGAVDYVRNSPAIQKAIENIRYAFATYVPHIVSFAKEVVGAIRDFLFPKSFDKEGNEKTYANKFEEVKDHISTFVTNIKTKLKELWEAFKATPIGKFLTEHLEPIIAWFKTFFTTDTSGEESPIDKLKKRFEAFQPIADWFIEKKDALINGIKALLGIKGEFSIDKVIGNIGDRINGLKESFKNVNWGSILKTAGIALGVAALFGIVKFVKNLANATSNITDILYMKNGGKIDTIGDTMLKIAAAVGIIALSLGLLATLVPTEKLNNAIAALKSMLLGLLIVTIVISLFDKVGVKNPGTQVFALAASVAVLAIGVSIMCENIKNNDPKVLWGALGIIALMMIVLGGIVIAMNKITQKLGGSKTEGSIGTIIGISIGVLIMCASVWAMCLLLKTFGAGIVWQAFAMVAIMTLALGGAVALINKNAPKLTSSIGNVLTIAAIVIALQVFIIDIAVLAAMISQDGTSVWGAFIMVGLLILALGYSINLMNKRKSSFSKALTSIGSIAAFGWALPRIIEALGDACSKIKDVPVWNLVVFMIGLAALLYIMPTIVEKIGKIDIKNLILGELGLVGLGYALGVAANGIAEACAKVKDVPVENLITFMAGLAIVIPIIALVVAGLGKLNPKEMIAGEAGLAGLGIALGIAVDAFATFAADGIRKMGQALWLLGNDLGDFQKATTDLDKGRVEDLMAMCKNIATTFASGLKVKEGATNNFRTELRALGVNLKTFNDNISGLTFDDFTEGGSFDSAIKNLVKLLSSETLGSIQTGSTEGFRNELGLLGENLSTFQTNISGFTTKAEGASNAIAPVTSFIDEVVQFVTNTNTKLAGGAVSALESNLTGVSSALNLYFGNLEGVTIDENSVGATPEQIRSAFTNINNALPDNTIVKNIVSNTTGAKGTDLTDFALGVVNLGTALKGYADNIKGISSTDVNTANDVLTAIGGLKTSLATGSESKFYDFADDYVKNERKTSLVTFGDEIGYLGGALKKYGEEIAGLSWWKIGLANGIIDKIATLKTETLTEESGILKFATELFYKRTTIQNFSDDIETLGQALGNYSTGIGTLNQTQINKANTVIDKLATLKLPVEGGFLGWVLGNASLSTFAEHMAQVGHGLTSFAGSIKDSGIEKLNVYKAMSPIRELSEIAIELSTNDVAFGGFVNMFTGEADIGALGAQLAAYGENLASFISKTEGIDRANVKEPLAILRSIVGIATTASTIPDTYNHIENMADSMVRALGSFGRLSEEAWVKTGGFFGKEEIIPDSDTMSKATKTLDSLPKAIQGVIDTTGTKEYTFTSLEDIGSGIIAAIVTGIENNSDDKKAVGITKALAVSFGSAIKAMNDVYPLFTPVGASLVSAITEGMASSASDNTSMNAIAGKLFSMLSDAKRLVLVPWEASFKSSGGNLVRAIANGILSKESDAKRNIRQVVINVCNTANGYRQNMVWIGENLDYGLAEGIRNKSYHPEGAFARVVRQAYDAGRRAGGIFSPSRETMWLGEMMDQGLAIGLLDYAGDVSKAAGSVVGGAIDGARDGMLTLSNMIFDDIDAEPVIRPVLDLSDVEAGMGGMNGLFSNQEIGVKSAILANRVAVSDAKNLEVASSMAASQPDISSQLDGLNARIDQLGSAISNMRVVTETGAVIGQIKSGMDRALGINAILADRGVL